MGILNFLSDVGQKLFGSKAEAAEVSDEKKAEDLKKNLDDLGLDTKDIKVEVTGDKVTLKGNAKDQETLEKAILQVGNTEGIAEVSSDDVAVSESDDSGTTYYTVKKGDILSRISKEVYGDANKYNVIFEANRPMLKSPDLIYPGQVLRIPPLKK